jgi:type IV pilus assembly protein PilN
VQNGSRIELSGAAQSSTRVSALMRNIDGSEWLRSPTLDVVETKASGVDRNSEFKLFAQQVSAGAPEGEEVEAATPPARPARGRNSR